VNYCCIHEEAPAIPKLPEPKAEVEPVAAATTVVGAGDTALPSVASGTQASDSFPRIEQGDCAAQRPELIDLAKPEMPEKLVLCTTGSRFTFTT
jgi:hypothetical protein